MKHVGLNVAMDPYVNSALVTLDGGLVLADVVNLGLARKAVAAGVDGLAIHHLPPHLAPEPIAPLQHGHARAAGRQDGSGREAADPRADHDHLQLRHPTERGRWRNVCQRFV